MIRSMMRCAMAVGVLLGVTGGLEAQQAGRGRAAIPLRVRDPYVGAMAIDADTGMVLIEDRADELVYPASVIKLMDLLLIQERLDAGELSLSNRVTVTAEAARMGGSQVYLAEKEVFTIEDLLFALMIQSANDAATALALHVGGTKAAFVDLMNRKAAGLGMTNTQYHSCHGLPPAGGDSPDVSTARDLAVLARELLKHPAALRYTSTRERGFRDGQFIMRTHNRLLAEVEGCDGLKTGYFKAGGYSIVATAQRGGRRVIAVVAGSPTAAGRDAQAREWLARGFASLPPLPPPAPAVVPVGPTNTPDAADGEPTDRPVGDGFRRAGGVALGALALVILGGIGVWFLRRSKREVF